MAAMPPIVVPIDASAAKGIPASVNQSSLLSDFQRVEVVLTVAVAVLPQIVSFTDTVGLSHQWALGCSAAVVALFTLIEGVKDAVNKTRS